MRDKEFDDKYLDHAWGEMEQLLNREMPVQRKRRRLLFWWWLLPLGGLLAAALIWYLPASVPAPKAPQPEERTTNTRPAAPVAGRTDTPAPPQKDIPVPPSASEGDKPTPNTHLLPLANTPTAAAPLPAATTAAPSDGTTAPIEAVPPREPLPPMATFDQLPLDIPRLASSNPFERLSWPDSLAVVPLAKQADWSLGLGTGSLLSLASTEFGWSAGADVQYRINERWRLRSGLQYEGVNALLDLEASLFEGEEFSDQDTPSTGDPNFTPDSGNQGEEIVLDGSSMDVRLQRISMPLLAEYRFQQAWSLSAGIHTNYLLEVRQREQAEMDANFSGGRGGLEPPLLSSGSEGIKPDDFERWTIQPTLGLSYRPARHWELSLYWRQGGNLSKLADTRLDNQQLAFQLRYRFSSF